MESRHRILIVDDTPMFRELGSLFLARTGEVLTAADGVAGLAVIRAERPEVVVADLSMPRLEGDALCRAIKADPEIRDIPVILVTPGDCSDDRARAIRAGADDVIAKPISRVVLIQAVNRLLRGTDRRALARVAMETPVCIRPADASAEPESAAEAWGTSRNLSRGGLFVEAERLVPRHREVELRFELPESPQGWLAPTAQVIWHRDTSAGPRGMGLQFLALDRDAVQQIDSFVYERAAARGDAGGSDADPQVAPR